jgi:hypothetical protein
MKVRQASMSRYRKFTITAAALLALPWWAAFALDTFGTMLACMPAIIFSFASFILAIVKMITRKEIKHNLIIMALSVLLIFSLGIPAKVSSRGLYELTAKRKVVMQELRPVFIQYRQDNGTYPSALEDLVPEYIPQIPAELVNDDRYDSYEKIFYELQGEEKAVFIFHTIRGPASAAIYNIHEDTFWYEP